MKKVLLGLSFVGSLLLYLCFVGELGKKYTALDKLGMIATGAWMAIFLYANLRRKNK